MVACRQRPLVACSMEQRACWLSVSATARHTKYVQHVNAVLTCVCCVLAVTCRRSRAAFLQQQEEQEQDQQQEQEQEEEQVGTASTDHASSSRARVQRACSRSELMPSVRTPGTLHPVVLGGAFMVLLGIVSWNLLHLGAAWLVSSLDRLGPHRFVSELASEHGWAGSCFQD